MPAQLLTIESKLRTAPVAVAGPGDFRLRDGKSADPVLALTQPNFSLYCLDFRQRQALFVETPPELDLSRAPFLYQAQYDAARRVLRMPFETLNRLADQVTLDPSKIILIYSVGRCGSTLVSQAFGAISGVESLSEADVFTQLRDQWAEQGFEGRHKERLLRSCLLMQCAPGRTRNAVAWAFKFRSLVADMAELFHAVVPEARIVFLYRNAVPWARSFLRFLRVRTPAEAEARLEWLAGMWLTVMDRCVEMQRQGIPMFLVRYEELTRSSHEVLAAMLIHCDLPMPPDEALEALLARDSQEGTAISRESLGTLPFEIPEALIGRFRDIMHAYSPAMTVDRILPGTFVPQQKGPPINGRR